MKKKLVLLLSLVLLISCSEKGKEEIGKEKFYSNLVGKVEGATNASSLYTTFKNHYEKGELYYSVENLKDGFYEGRSGKDNYGYEHVITFEVANGKIIKVNYDEIKGENGKKFDENYWENMGINLSKVYEKYEKQLIEKQNMMDLDQVAGASYSLYRMRLAFSKAIDI